MISEAYREQQKELHASGLYGISGHKYATIVAQLAKQLNTTDILDYGCGQRTLEKSLGFLIRNYDPAIAEFSDSPAYPADLVVCSDVLEHIEPEHLDAVLDDLQRVTRKLAFLIIATGPANKVLPDGRNAHLIQEGPEFWLPKIMDRFSLHSYKHLGKEFSVTGWPK